MTATTLRPRTPADDDFIFDSWMRSFRASHESGPYHPDEYFPAARTAIARILARPSVQVLVADVTTEVDGEPVTFIAGYLVHEPAWKRWSKQKRRLEAYAVVHFLFVREQARGEGVAGALLDAAGVRRNVGSTAYSFSMPASRDVLGKAARFIPDAARFESRKETP